MPDTLTDLKCGRILCEAPIKIVTDCFKKNRYYFEFSNKVFKECEIYALWYLNQRISYGPDVIFVSCDGTNQPIDVVMCNPD